MGQLRPSKHSRGSNMIWYAPDGQVVTGGRRLRAFWHAYLGTEAHAIAPTAVGFPAATTETDGDR